MLAVDFCCIVFSSIEIETNTEKKKLKCQCGNQKASSVKFSGTWFASNDMFGSMCGLHYLFVPNKNTLLPLRDV